MPYALSTQGQGTSSYIAVPTWTRPASSDWEVGITCKIFSLAANAQILGRSSSTAGSLRVLTTGALVYRDTSDLITSAAGAISINTYYTFVLRRVGSIIELWYGPEGMDSSLVGGTKAGETPTLTSAILNPLNQIGRFGTTTRNDIEVKRFWTVGGTYTDSVDGSTAPSTGVNWPFTSAARNLVITSATGTADSWWVFYTTGGGDQTVSLGTLDSTVVTYSPTVTKDKLVELGTISDTDVIYSPTVVKDKLIELPQIPSGVIAYQPTITKGSPSLTIGLGTLVNTSVINGPTVKPDKLITLYRVESTALLYEALVRKDKWVTLETIGSVSELFAPEVIGGSIPLPNIELFQDEGYGLHIRTAKEMNDMILALAKRVQILEQNGNP